MMYAHLPWLLASSLTAEQWEGVGQNGSSEEGERREVRRIEGRCLGEGVEEAKELESCIYY